MIYIYLIYGLSFFVLWTVLLIYHMKLYRFTVARHLWMIGLFGLSHGISDWLIMLIVIQKLQEPVFKIVSLVFLIVSFSFLMQFGLSTLALKRRKKKALTILPVLLFAVLIFIITTSDQKFLMGDIFSRYLLGLPGSLLTVYALLLLTPDLKKMGRPALVRDLKFAALGFLCYGFFSGLVVPEAGFFPASVLNYRVFFSELGIPVELFRALSVLAIAFSLTRVLHVFETEIEASMRRTNEELEERVRARTEELDRLNQELKQRDLRQKAILDNIPDLAWLKDEDSRFIMVNLPFARTAGTTPEQLIGKTDLDVWPHELAERYRADDKEVMKTGARKQVEEPLVDAEGNPAWNETIKMPIYDEQGEIIGTTGIARDMTERRKMEAAVRESEQRYRAITENALDAIVTIDEGSTIVVANDAVERIFGYTPQELYGRSLTMLMPQGMRARHRIAVKKYLRSGKRQIPWNAIELPGLCKDGSEVPLEMSFGEFRVNGRRFFSGIVRDISERKKMENALRESEHRRLLIMDAVPALISYVGTDLRYLFVNHQYETWWKRPAADFIGRPVKDMLGEKRYEAIKERISAALRGERVSYEWVVPRNGDERYVQVVYVPHKAPDGTVLGFITMINDITELKRAEKAVVESEKRIQLIIDTVPALISYVGADLRYQFVNRQYEEWFRIPAAGIIGRHVMDMLGEARYREIEKFVNMALNGERVSYERSLGLGHEQRHLHIDYVPHIGMNREVYGFFTFITDITERKKIEERLQEANDRLSSVLNSITEAYYALDADWRVIEINREAEKILGPEKEVLGKVYWEQYPQNRGTEIDREYHIAVQEKRPVHFEVRSRINSRWYEIHGYPRADRLEVYFRDVTERKRLEEIVQHRAYHDPLTDLPNRLLLKDILELEIAQARRNRKKVSVLFLDLDRFKQINDTLGHAAGDKLLKQVATRLKKCVRESDSVARIGGDEFNIVLSDFVAPEKLTAAVGKITSAFRDPFIVANEELHVTTSIGISIYPDDARDIETLLKYADMAMYHAKEHGRNRYQFYNPAISTRTFEHALREHRLREALERGELIVHYLPQVEARSGNVTGAEALLRWNHPKLGLLPPGKFMPLAEETGLIIPIGLWVLRTVIRQLKTWHQAGYRPISITVNLSDRQFHQKDLAEMTGKLLREAGLEPGRLEFEIAESTAARDVEFTGPHLQKLIDAGVTVSLDDYGTARLSLNQLKKLPFRKLKIDQYLIRDILSNADDRIIVEAMIAMMHTMRIKASAEGVETPEQLKLLQERGCDEVQGYLFSEPGPAEEFEKLLVSQAG